MFLAAWTKLLSITLLLSPACSVLQNADPNAPSSTNIESQAKTQLPPKTFSNTVTTESTCAYPGPTSTVTGPCHRYAFRFPKGQLVTITTRSETIGMALALTNGPTRLPTEKSLAGETISVTFKSEGRQSLFVAASKSGIKGAYELHVSPGPEVLKTPMGVEEKARKELARVKSKSKRHPSDIVAELRESQCKRNGLTIVYATSTSNSTAYYFCDGVKLTNNRGVFSFSYGLSGRKYEQHTEASSARLEIAEHNYSILRTQSSQRQLAKARNVFEKRVSEYVKRHFKTKRQYVERAKKSDIEVVEH